LNYLAIAERLENGENVRLKPHGNSMTPIIKSGQPIVLSPVSHDELSVGDVVLAKVNGHWYIHKLTAIGDDGRYQISNNHGHVNGWTRRVYGRVTEIG
jgi:hypothetical protein